MLIKKNRLHSYIAVFSLILLFGIIGYDGVHRREFRESYGALFIDEQEEIIRSDITIDELEELEYQWGKLLGMGDLEKLATIERLKRTIVND